MRGLGRGGCRAEGGGGLGGEGREGMGRERGFMYEINAECMLCCYAAMLPYLMLPCLSYPQIHHHHITVSMPCHPSPSHLFHRVNLISQQQPSYPTAPSPPAPNSHSVAKHPSTPPVEP